MKQIKLAIVGGAGRMGQQIIEETKNFKNINLVSIIENKNSIFLNKKINNIKIEHNKEKYLNVANTIIDFSSPKSTLETLKYAEKLKKK